MYKYERILTERRKSEAYEIVARRLDWNIYFVTFLKCSVIETGIVKGDCVRHCGLRESRYDVHINHDELDMLLNEIETWVVKIDFNQEEFTDSQVSSLKGLFSVKVDRPIVSVGTIIILIHNS